MTSTNDTNPRTAQEAAHQLNASDPVFWAGGLEFTNYTRAFAYADRMARESGERVYVMRVGRGMPLAVCEPQRSIPWVSR